MSAIAAASAAESASASIVSARASLSFVASTLTSSASVVSASSAAVASSVSMVSDRSAAIDAASSSLDSRVDSMSQSFALASSQLDASNVALASSTSALGISLASVQSVASVQATVVQALASSASLIASQTSSLAAQATATGIATACQPSKFLGNGHCYSTCPAAYPEQFRRQGTFGLCCTKGAQECLNADATAATTCLDSYFLTILDPRPGFLTGTCTPACTTTTGSAETQDLVEYKYKQLDGVYPQCVSAAGCELGSNADSDSLLCCPDGELTCVDQTATGAVTCEEGLYFHALDTTATPPTGSCGANCPATSFYSGVAGDNKCLTACPVAGAFYTVAGFNYCCADSNAATCSSTASLTCTSGWVLDSAHGVCVEATKCPNGASDNGVVCCPASALTCSDATTATSCGADQSGAQTYLASFGTCIAKEDCCNGASVLAGGSGVCCQDEGATSCASIEPKSATACDRDQGYYLKETAAGTLVGTCSQQCADGFLETVGPAAGTCVAACASGSSFSKALLTRKRGAASSLLTCCPANSASCNSDGAITCSDGFFLQADGTCSTGCTAPSVKSSSGGFCCPAGTKACSGNGAHDATVCQSDYYMLDNTCVATCPDGTIAGTANGVKSCNCTGKNVNTCDYTGQALTCSSGYVLSTIGGTPTCVVPTQCIATGSFAGTYDDQRDVASVAACQTFCAASPGYAALWHPLQVQQGNPVHCYCTSDVAAGAAAGTYVAESLCNALDGQGLRAGSVGMGNSQNWAYMSIYSN